MQFERQIGFGGVKWAGEKKIKREALPAFSIWNPRGYFVRKEAQLNAKDAKRTRPGNIKNEPRKKMAKERYRNRREREMKSLKPVWLCAQCLDDDDDHDFVLNSFFLLFSRRQQHLCI